MKAKDGRVASRGTKQEQGNKVVGGQPDRAAPQQAARANELIQMDEAIAMLKTTRPTFYRWVRSGKIKGMKVGRQWRFYREDIERFLKGQEPRIDLPADLTPLITQLEGAAGQVGKNLRGRGVDQPADVRAVSAMIFVAYVMRSSDIHISPLRKPDSDETLGVLRYRVDGVMHVIAEFDVRLVRPLVERWKIMAGCNVHENRLPQDGRIQVMIEGKKLDLRISFVPVLNGEAVTARILDASTVALYLDRIEYAPPDKEKLLRCLDSGWGMVVVAGPTGSGKTTVAYTCINHLAGPGRKVMSVEDPVEFHLPWVEQIQVSPQAGLTFPAALRSILRADPDVVLIGEVRDRETLQVAHQLSLTGHLVVVTLHVPDASHTLKRMVELTGQAFIVGDATKLVLSQRLPRLLCKACSREGVLEQQILERAEELARTGGLDWGSLPKHFRVPVGCDKCHKTGYHGRTVIAEALEVTSAISEALNRGASAEEIQAIAVKQGMTTLAADGIRRAAAGLTSLNEVLRVAGAR